MTYSLINKCAKNYYNRTFIVQVIAKNVVTCFFETQCISFHRTKCPATSIYMPQFDDQLKAARVLIIYSLSSLQFNERGNLAAAEFLSDNNCTAM